jgi:hypothetical protein
LTGELTESIETGENHYKDCGRVSLLLCQFRVRILQRPIEAYEGCYYEVAEFNRYVVMDISLLAHKNLDSLHGYIDLKYADRELSSIFLSNFQLFTEDEKVIGFYINQSNDRDLIIITDRQIVIRNLDRFISIKYNNIQSVYTEHSKGANRIFVCQKDEIFNSILVTGTKEGKFLDLYGFLRFIKKVLVNINLNNAATLEG